MPVLTRWFVHAWLLYFLPGFTIGAQLLAQKGLSYHPPVWTFFPLHMEFLLIGWFVQLALGVAFWIMPRFSTGSPRGNVRLVWLSFVLVNVGLIIGVLQLWLPFAILVGRILEISAGIVFASGSWRRVKPHGIL